MASSKTRIQNYIRQNKISELFEEMMGKLIKDLPASPIHYLVNLLQQKEKKVKHITREESAPTKGKKIEVSDNAMLWATAPILPVKKQTSPREQTSTEDHAENRKKYSKPWLTHSKKSPVKAKAGDKLSQTLPASSGSPKKAGKPEWNRKTRVSEESLDDVVDGEVDLGLVYANPKIVGETRVQIRDDNEEIESELRSHGKAGEIGETETTSDMKNKKSSKLSAKDAKKRRMEELKRLAEENKPKNRDINKTSMKVSDDEEDDALEVLEDADDLVQEGVKNPPNSGFVFGHSGKKSKEEIEFVLNMSKFFDELGGMSGVNQSQTIKESESRDKLLEDDEDFESASQVTGPRRPVWEAPESEVESVHSQINSARRSGFGVEMFDVNMDNNNKSSEPAKQKSKTPESRPRTAPSRTGSDLNVANGRDTYRVNDPKSSKSPRSRPTTPQGSEVGNGRTSRAMSQTSNHSGVLSSNNRQIEQAKAEGKSKKRKKKSKHGEDEPDTRVKTPSKP